MREPITPDKRPRRKTRQDAGLLRQAVSYCRANGMGALPPDSTAGPAGSRLSADLAAHVEAIVHAAEREARAAEQAIAEHRRSAEEEVRRYLAAARLSVDAETAARAARIETLTTATRRLADELTDAVAALTRELHAADPAAETRMPRAPWPTAPAPEQRTPPPPAPEPTWSRIEEEPVVAAPAAEPIVAHAEPEHIEEPTASTNGAPEIPMPSAARLVAIEMAVGGSSRAEVEQHLRAELHVADPEPLLDDVFGVTSTAGSRLAWGEP